ncbi:hypothetical protein FOZ63_020797 [Perkinsus olseni]|uniref:Uncharacterized protein n=1 Tax=Perkinsus olseni TaxID=32597 RepID=A0A7J6SQH7_PEROL|nr:hypothetical protein FOZ63_020797 [Perkinsus olseni]
MLKAVRRLSCLLCGNSCMLLETPVRRYNFVPINIKRTKPHITRVVTVFFGSAAHAGFYIDAGFRCDDINLEVYECIYEMPEHA